MNRHPSEDALLTWCETGVAPEREPLIVEHVDGCARCRERAEAMREILASMRARPLEQAPREWVEAALDAIHRNAAPHVPAPEGAGALAARARAECRR